MVEYEKGISRSLSPIAALSSSDAIRLFHAGALCDDGGMRMDGLSVLYAPAKSGNVGVCHIGRSVSAYIQDSAGAYDMECDRCDCRHIPGSDLLRREEDGGKDKGELSAFAA